MCTIGLTTCANVRKHILADAALRDEVHSHLMLQEQQQQWTPPRQPCCVHCCSSSPPPLALSLCHSLLTTPIPCVRACACLRGQVHVLACARKQEQHHKSPFSPCCSLRYLASSRGFLATCDDVERQRCRTRHFTRHESHVAPDFQVLLQYFVVRFVVVVRQALHKPWASRRNLETFRYGSLHTLSLPSICQQNERSTASSECDTVRHGSAPRCHNLNIIT